MQQIAEALTAYSSLGNGELPDELSIAAYEQFTERAFLNLYDRGAIVPITLLTTLGERDLAQMRKSAGIGYVEPPPTPRQLTADELLEEEVRNDYATLSGSKMREKRRTNRVYEMMYQRIADTLDSRVTANVRAGA